MGEGNTQGRADHWLTLMEEAGVSRTRRRLHAFVWLGLVLLAVVSVVVIVVGIFVDYTLIVIGVVLSFCAAVGIVVSSWRRKRLVAGVRWEEGTVTFRTVEPGSVGENGQYVECNITVRPALNIRRVATTIGPLDAERMHVGTTMRCLIDRAATFNVLRVFPYAADDAKLPSGRVLKFHKV